MAHEITANDHMVSGSNVTPWHGLGTIVAGNLTAAEAVKAAKLDWDVSQEPVFDGDMLNIVRLTTELMAICRSTQAEHLAEV